MADESDRSTYLFILAVPLLCWGIWPTIRQFCGAERFRTTKPSQCCQGGDLGQRSGRRCRGTHGRGHSSSGGGCGYLSRLVMTPPPFVVVKRAASELVGVSLEVTSS